MSVMAESNVYESMADDGLNEKRCLAAICDDSDVFMFIPKIERNIQTAVRDVSEEIAEEKIRILHDGIIQDAYDGVEQPPIYYEEALSACEEVEVDYKSSMILPINKMEEEWEESAQFESSVVDSSYEDNHVEMSSYHEESENVEDSDEETIATFLTSAGQRLALYAVEDSDEVFAVAVYDESGEPPTNFQFLMKADVERLIGEGAVRTVKKPTQMKKQLFSTDPPVFAQQAEEPSVEDFQLKVEHEEPAQYQNNHCNTHKTTSSDDNNLSTTEIVQEAERESSPLPDADKQPDLTYLSHLMEDACPPLDRIEETPPTEEITTDNSSVSDFLEQSTVQCIFLGDGDSDGELTLADIEETLKNHRPVERKKSLLKKSHRSSISDSTEERQSHISNPTSNDLSAFTPIDDIPAEPVEKPNACRPNFAMKYPRNSCFPRKAATSLICRREKLHDERPGVPSGTSLLIASAEPKITTEPTPESSQIGSRVKRSRKQQLTSVNRDDSEIIIQPASFASEEDEPTRKRGRGRRKPGRPASYKTKAGSPKKSAQRSQRARAVELIEIDVDEEHRLPGKKQDIVEITIDESKEKGSSDKENEVIMVGDSEDEAREAAEASAKSASTILKCDHCLRSFRQKRALETHSRVCPKSPDFVRRAVEKTATRRTSGARSGDSSTAVKKQYACKICQEKFDVVVALARHVRAMHSQRKKINNTSAQNAATPSKTAPVASSKTEETTRKSQPDEDIATLATASPVAIARRRRKTKTRIKPGKRSWKSEKLHCEDCGRWFSSDALLTAHSLQHATKKSEKQIRRCPTCRKIFKSRLLYIRHLRMHSRAKQLQKKLHHTRQATGKTASVRKRGRPRKL